MFRNLARFDYPAFGELNRALRLMDETLGDAWQSDLRSAPRGTFPFVNVGESEDAVNLYVFAPGLGTDDIDVSVENNNLVIQGRRPRPEENGERTWYRQERFFGEFTRAVRLPEGIDPEKVSAEMANGVLTIRLEKRAEQRPRRIEVKAA